MISAVTCCRNEAWRINEWVEYHAKLGVDAFYIANDNSTDNTKEVVENLSKKYNCILCEPAKIGSYSNSQNPNIYGQNADLHVRLQQSYKKLMNLAKKDGHSWALVIDVDEFIVPINKEDCRPRFLSEYLSENSIERIYVHSFDMHGPFSANNSVLNSDKSWSKNEKAFGIVNGVRGWFKDRGKSIVNLSKWSGDCICAHNIDNSPCINEGDSTNLGIELKNMSIAYKETIRLNHYRNHPLLNTYSDTFANAKLIK